MSEEPTLYKTQGPDGKDDGNYIFFTWDVEKDEPLSIKEGRPIFDKVLRGSVMSPGQTKSQTAFIVKRQRADGTEKIYGHYMLRYKAQIDQFEKSESGPELTGTPLSELSFLDRAQRATFAAFNVHTAEALAGLSDTALSGMGPGIRTLREKAKAYIEQAAGAAPINRLTDENAKLRAEYDTLRANHEDLVAKVKAMESGKRGPGRPRNATDLDRDEAA